MDIKKLWAILLGAALVILAAIFIIPAPTRVHASELPPILPVLLEATQDLTRMQGAPQFEMMTTSEMQADACLNPRKCPVLVSIHPPMTDRIIVNSDFDIAGDLNAQGQIIHVLTMYLLEKSGRYSPDMPCDLVMKIDAFADTVQLAFLDAMTQQYITAGRNVPPIAKPQVMTFCTPPNAKPKEYF